MASTYSRCLSSAGPCAYLVRRRPVVTKFGPSFVLASASLELVRLVRRENVAAGKRTVASARLALQLHLYIHGGLGGVHLLLERPETIPHHHDLVEERL